MAKENSEKIKILNAVILLTLALEYIPTEIWRPSLGRLPHALTLKYSTKPVKMILLTLYVPIHKMVKHTQTIRRQFADELFECVWPFCEIGA